MLLIAKAILIFQKTIWLMAKAILILQKAMLLIVKAMLIFPIAICDGAKAKKGSYLFKKVLNVKEWIVLTTIQNV